jgi:hypothetical protein
MEHIKKMGITPRPNNIYLQTDEIREELEKENVDHLKLLKLLKEMLFDLSNETTAIGLIEVNNTCLSFHDRRDYYSKFPDYFFTIIGDCITLHDYPSKFALASPSEILERINDVYSSLEGTASVVTKSDEILRLYDEKKSVEEISKELSIDNYYVKRALIISGNKTSYD